MRSEKFDDDDDDNNNNNDDDDDDDDDDDLIADMNVHISSALTMPNVSSATELNYVYC